MKELKITMLGAGSGFVINIARDLRSIDCFDKARFVLMDINQKHLDKSFKAVCDIIKNQNKNIEVSKTTDLKEALDGADYVIASCEQNRYEFWKKDIEVPEQFGVYQVLGENGGPGGQIHAMRNISLFKDWLHPYYDEKSCEVIDALETNGLLYVDAINIVNHGAISNLPDDAIVDVPAVVKGGQVRGVNVGELPMAAAELCRRQITIHEMIAKATHEGDDKLVIQALCLDPYIRSITQAKKTWQAFKKEYIDLLPTFK